MEIKASFIIGFILTVIFSLSLNPILAQDSQLGSITSYSGEVQIKSKVTTPVDKWQRIDKTDYPVHLEDYIKTLQGQATITFLDKSELDLDEYTEIIIDKFYLPEKDRITRNIKCILGKVNANIAPRKDLQTQFETPSGIAAIKGSTLSFNIGKSGKTGLNLEKGNLDFSNVDTKTTFSMASGHAINALYNSGENSLELESVQGTFNISAPDATITLTPSDIVLTTYNMVTGETKISSKKGNIKVTYIDPKTGKKSIKVIAPGLSVSTQPQLVSKLTAAATEQKTETGVENVAEEEVVVVTPVIPETKPTYTPPREEAAEEEEDEDEDEDDDDDEEETVTDLYVDPVQGDNSNAGTESAPFKTLTYAVSYITDESLSSITVHLVSGTYNSTSGETFPISLADLTGITIQGSEDDDSIIDANSAGGVNSDDYVFYLQTLSGDNYIKNLNIKGGKRGVYFPASGTLYVQNCEITDNTENGIFIYPHSSITFEVSRTKIHDNGSAGSSGTTWGGGIYLKDDDGSSLSGKIENCLMYSNHATYGGGVYMYGIGEGNVKIINSTIASNSACIYGQGIYLSNSSPVIINTIFALNSELQGKYEIFVEQTNYYPNVYSCCAYSEGNLPPICFDNEPYSMWPDSWTQDGNSTTENPVFKDASSNDYRLIFSETSVCIDKGTSTLAPSVDLAGTGRPLDGNSDGTSEYDIGCYEYDPENPDPPVTGRIYNSVTGVNVTGVVTGIYRAGASTSLSTTNSNPYRFDVNSGSYFLGVSKTGYGFPSQIVSATGSGSHGEDFVVAGQAVSIDIPIDPKDMLTVTKTCNKEKVMVGDIVTYNIKIENNYWFRAVENVVLKDEIVNGFKYVNGSTCSAQGTSTKSKTSDPTVASHIANFSIGTVPAYTTINLSYQVRVGGGMVPGKYSAKGVCVKSTTEDTCSNYSEVVIEVVEDVLFDKGTIIGKVFVDLNSNGVQDAKDEIGISSVIIATEYGVVVETDEDGKYHIADVPPGRHLLKVDPSTLPEGAGFTTENPYLVKITPGLLAKVNFGITQINTKENEIRDTKSGIRKIAEQFFIVALAEGEVRHLDTSGNIEMINKDDRYDDGFQVDGRLSFYLKGKVLGKYLITASLDTERVRTKALKRQVQSRLFKNLDPDKYYPVYGDASSVDYSATDTQDILYVLVEWDESYAKWGSFVTNMPLYNRSLSGGKIEYRSVSKTKFGEPYTEIDAFYAVSRKIPRHEEFVGTGGSLYYLSKRDVVEGSEKIRVEVRDRLSKRVIFSYILNEEIDYEIDYDTGRILLRKPLSSVNWRYNSSVVSTDILTGERVYLVVDYEYYTLLSLSNESFGGRAKQHITSYIGVEGQYVEQDREGTDPYKLYSTKGELRLNEDTAASVRYSHSKETQMGSGASFDGGLTFTELASTNSDNKSGSAVEVNAETKLFGNTDLRFNYSRQDQYFSSTDSLANAGTQKYVGEALTRLMDNFVLGVKHVTTKVLEGTILQDITGNLNTHITTALADWKPGRWDLRLEYQHQEVNRVIEDYTYFGTLPVRDNDFVAGRVGYQFSDWFHPYVRGQGTVKGKTNNQGTVGADIKLFGGKTVLGVAETVGNLGDSTLIGLTSELDSTRSAFANIEIGNRLGLGKFTKTSYGENVELTPTSRMYASTDYSMYQERLIRGDLIGYEKELTDNLLLGVSYERSKIERKHFVNVINRDSASISLSYLNIDWLKLFTKLECREDNGRTSTIRQWVTENDLLWYITQDISVLGRANWSRTRDRTNDTTEAKFHELGVGLAYRPVHFDRLNLLAKYSYLTDLPPDVHQDFVENIESRQNVYSIEGSFDLFRYLELVGKFACRDNREKVGPRDWTDSDKYLYLGRLNFHITSKWDIAGEYRVLDCPDSDDKKSGWLVEVDREITKYIRVGVGYNFTDFDDDITSDDSYDAKGFFVRLTGKY